MQFTSDDYINLLKDNKIKISMDGKGRAVDNQRIERFFRSYKWEKLYLEEYETGSELKSIIKEYILLGNCETLEKKRTIYDKF